MKFKKELLVESRECLDTITTLHDPSEDRLRKLFERMREEFESRELPGVKWIHGHANLANALSKYNPTMSLTLNAILAKGIRD